MTTHETAIAVVVPVKGFRQAKERLAARLDESTRCALAEAMAARVVRAARPLPVYVVCDEPEVAEWARSVGAGILHVEARGLNASVTAAVATLADRGVARVVVAHGDLPLAESFDHLLPEPTDHPHDLVLVPDRHRDGTNVLVTPAASPPVFAYGAGSFHRHLFAAARAGLSVRVVTDPRLGFDVDTPSDLTLPDGASVLDLVPESLRGVVSS